MICFIESTKIYLVFQPLQLQVPFEPGGAFLIKRSFINFRGKTKYGGTKLPASLTQHIVVIRDHLSPLGILPIFTPFSANILEGL